MKRPSELPDMLAAAFSVASASEIGVGDGRLRGRDLGHPFHGVRTRHPVLPDAQIRELCRAYVPRMAEHQFFSHETALALSGHSMPGWPYRPGIHVSTHRPRREPRTRGVVGHRLQARESAVRTTRDGLPVEDPARAWRQCGSLWVLDDLIAAADSLAFDATQGASRMQLRDEIEIMGDVRNGLLRRALAEARDGVRSPRETRLRLLLVRAGLPEPEINWVLRDHRGVFVAELDQRVSIVTLDGARLAEWGLGERIDERPVKAEFGKRHKVPWQICRRPAPQGAKRAGKRGTPA